MCHIFSKNKRPFVVPLTVKISRKNCCLQQAHCAMALPIHVQNCVSAIRSPPAGSRATESDGAAHR